MKLISPKTALASLLGCAFVTMKLIYFRDLSDLPIIIVVGYKRRRIRAEAALIWNTVIRQCLKSQKKMAW